MNKKHYVPYTGSTGFKEQVNRVRSYSKDKNIVFFLIRRFLNEVLAIIAYWAPMNEIRVWCNRFRGAKIGRNVQIGLHCLVETSYPELITIEDGAGLAGQVYLLAHSIPQEHFKGKLMAYTSAIHIKKGALLGIRTTVMPGITIGEKAVVSAGAIVTKDVDDGAIVSGNPAEVVARMSFRN